MHFPTDRWVRPIDDRLAAQRLLDEPRYFEEMICIAESEYECDEARAFIRALRGLYALARENQERNP